MSVLTIAAALDRYWRARRSVVVSRDRLASTIKPLRRVIGRRAVRRQAEVAAAVRAHVAGRRKAGKAVGTVRRELVTLRAALRLDWKEGHLAFQPYVQLPPAVPGRQRALTKEEASRLLHHCDRRIELAARLALTTAPRIGAILELDWDRVDPDGGTIDYRAPHPRADRRKHRAVVPIPAALTARLRRERARAGGDGRVVPIGRSTAERLMRVAAADAGLAGVTFHVLRHTAATWMLRGDGGRKVPLLEASRMLGHRSTLITEQVYVHLVAADLQAAADFLGRATP